MSSALLSDSTVAFIQREVAIDMASCGADLQPSGCRGFAAQVSADRRRITLCVRAREAAELLRDAQARDNVAVVFCLPETEAAIQIKGSQVAVHAVTPKQVEHVQRYCQAFADGIVPLGFDPRFATAHMHVEPNDLLALSFTPEQVFEQTPGPRAGQALTGGLT